MVSKEILENRREISLKLCLQIRNNNFLMIKAKNFSDRPYLDSEIKRKFNTLNYLRLLASEKNYSDPRWYSRADFQRNHWSLKDNATPVFLEVSNVGDISLQEFFNAADVNEVEKFETENKTLDEVLDFLIVRGILESGERTSLQDGIDAVKNYAAKFFQDRCVLLKMDLFLPTYSDVILKFLRNERIKPIAEEINFDSLFQGLKIIYHGSESEIKDKQGLLYTSETILTGVSAYEFLYSWKNQKENSKTWIDFSYQNYNHGKLLLDDNSDDFLVSEFLKKRLEKNRRDLLSCPKNSPLYILCDTDELIPKEKIIERIKKESADFKKIFSTFETDEEKYLEIHSQKML